MQSSAEVKTAYIYCHPTNYIYPIEREKNVSNMQIKCLKFTGIDIVIPLAVLLWKICCQHQGRMMTANFIQFQLPLFPDCAMSRNFAVVFVFFAPCSTKTVSVFFSPTFCGLFINRTALKLRAKVGPRLCNEVDLSIFAHWGRETRSEILKCLVPTIWIKQLQKKRSGVVSRRISLIESNVDRALKIVSPLVLFYWRL